MFPHSGYINDPQLLQQLQLQQLQLQQLQLQQQLQQPHVFQSQGADLMSSGAIQRMQRSHPILPSIFPAPALYQEQSYNTQAFRADTVMQVQPHMQFYPHQTHRPLYCNQPMWQQIAPTVVECAPHVGYIGQQQVATQDQYVVITPNGIQTVECAPHLAPHLINHIGQNQFATKENSEIFTRHQPMESTTKDVPNVEFLGLTNTQPAGKVPVSNNCDTVKQCAPTKENSEISTGHQPMESTTKDVPNVEFFGPTNTQPAGEVPVSNCDTVKPCVPTKENSEISTRHLPTENTTKVVPNVEFLGPTNTQPAVPVSNNCDTVKACAASKVLNKTSTPMRETLDVEVQVHREQTPELNDDTQNLFNLEISPVPGHKPRPERNLGKVGDYFKIKTGASGPGGHFKPASIAAEASGGLPSTFPLKRKIHESEPTSFEMASTVPEKKPYKRLRFMPDLEEDKSSLPQGRSDKELASSGNFSRALASLKTFYDCDKAAVEERERAENEIIVDVDHDEDEESYEPLGDDENDQNDESQHLISEIISVADSDDTLKDVSGTDLDDIKGWCAKQSKPVKVKETPPLMTRRRATKLSLQTIGQGHSTSTGAAPTKAMSSLSSVKLRLNQRLDHKQDEVSPSKIKCTDTKQGKQIKTKQLTPNKVSKMLNKKDMTELLFTELTNEQIEKALAKAAKAAKVDRRGIDEDD